MAYSVTSWFAEQLSKPAPDIVRRFYIGSSDYTDYVTGWPTIKRKWDDLRPISAAVKLANQERTFNFLIDDKTRLRTTCSLKFGFNHPSSGDELVTIHAGTIDKISFKDGNCQLTIVDKVRQLSERVLGTPDSPISYTGSNYLPSDITWYIVVSYGGFSAVQSTSNPDIDYDSWLSWGGVFSGDSVYLNAHFEDVKVMEAVRKIAKMTRSAIYLENDKLTFHRFTLPSTYETAIDDSTIEGMQISVDIDDVVNRQYVFAGYDTTSDDWSIVVYDEKPTSINSYGLKEDTLKDKSVWYVTSQAAINVAQRVGSTQGEPFEKVSLKLAGAQALIRQLGETINLTDSFHSIDQGYRIMEYSLNLDTGRMITRVDRSQFSRAFTLDVSTLDSGDVLT